MALFLEDSMSSPVAHVALHFSVLMTDTHVVILMFQKRKGAQHLCKPLPLCFDSDWGTWHSSWVGDLTEDPWYRDLLLRE